jgi:hypothetical protein
LLAAIPDSDDQAVGFHAQQSIEKCIKAVLSVSEIAFRKTHDLVELIDILRDSGKSLPPDAEALSRLNPFAVTMRIRSKGAHREVFSTSTTIFTRSADFAYAHPRGITGDLHPSSRKARCKRFSPVSKKRNARQLFGRQHLRSELRPYQNPQTQENPVQKTICQKPTPPQVHCRCVKKY